jgi:hypothetical protein
MFGPLLSESDRFLQLRISVHDKDNLHYSGKYYINLKLSYIIRTFLPANYLSFCEGFICESCNSFSELCNVLEKEVHHLCIVNYDSNFVY